MNSKTFVIKKGLRFINGIRHAYLLFAEFLGARLQSA